MEPDTLPVHFHAVSTLPIAPGFDISNPLESSRGWKISRLQFPVKEIYRKAGFIH
ncbi:hypothetical protein AG1IA_06366 [Rhizoctonia solani AG-1 IA]|uniref:Uncharacterized protein n=1 Tax=Thanatephorus cucumeris (strain AG1-IA) TaxID=983506 RepID=L8WS30_THACA|nr:hypothetical protein AG1IA_06366 [Rhizoctonia solani AG-1 IA]